MLWRSFGPAATAPGRGATYQEPHHFCCFRPRLLVVAAAQRADRDDVAPCHRALRTRVVDGAAGWSLAPVGAPAPVEAPTVTHPLLVGGVLSASSSSRTPVGERCQASSGRPLGKGGVWRVGFLGSDRTAVAPPYSATNSTRAVAHATTGGQSVGPDGPSVASVTARDQLRAAGRGGELGMGSSRSRSRMPSLARMADKAKPRRHALSA